MHCSTAIASLNASNMNAKKASCLGYINPNKEAF